MMEKPDWHKLAQKSLPYLLALVLALGVSVTFLGNTNAQALTDFENLVDWKYMGQANMESTKAQVEAEKQTLQQKQDELAATLKETEELLAQLNSVKQETQDLITQAQNQSGAVADKLGEMNDTYDRVEEAYDRLEEAEQQKWVVPIQYTNISSPFGNRTHPVAGEAQFHPAVDLAAPYGTPIVATRSGTVEMATYDDVSGYYVVINHLDGYDSRYMHMQKYIVEPGQFVVTGQIIGYCGASGVATGSHLHFAIYKNNTPVNPADYMTLKAYITEE